MGFEYPDDVSFQCARCGLCCGDTKSRRRHVVLLKEEARTISETVLNPIKSFATITKNRKPYVYEMRKTRKQQKCVFLHGTQCRIYAVRPLVCRFYPFELSRSKSGKLRFLCTGECPGIGKGERLEREYFEKQFSEAFEKLET